MNAEILTIAAGLPKEEHQRQLNAFFGNCAVSDRSNVLLKAIGWIGRIIHRPLYSFFVKKTAKLTGKSVFYDSVLFGLLVYIYPVIVTLLSRLSLGPFAGWSGWIGFVFSVAGYWLWLGAKYS